MTVFAVGQATVTGQQGGLLCLSTAATQPGTGKARFGKLIPWRDRVASVRRNARKGVGHQWWLKGRANPPEMVLLHGVR